jgi:beta-N-acetylhexosaminidase
LPAGLSPVVVRGLLRGELGFDGLIVTDALDMSGLTLYFDQEEAAVRSVEAGADMLIKPSAPDAAVRGLLRAVQSGRLTEKRIEESARRILAAKYDLGLVQRRETPLNQIDHSLSGPDVIAFAREVAERAITLVRNDNNLVPINIRPETKVFNLAITNGDDRLFIASPFIAEMERNGTRIETIVLDGRSSEEEIQQAIKRARAADVVIASLYGRVRAGEARSVGLPESSARALTQLINHNVPIVSISFGNPYLLQSFPSLRTYVMAYGDMPTVQEAAARALLGKVDITGRLPISLPGLYQRGTGIQLRADIKKAR